MGKKRQLTEDEKRLIGKNLEILRDELEYLEKVELPRVKLTLDTADIVVKRQIQETERQKRRIEAEIEERKNSIAILEKQLVEGVEVKEKTEDKK